VPLADTVMNQAEPQPFWPRGSRTLPLAGATASTARFLREIANKRAEHGWATLQRPLLEKPFGFSAPKAPRSEDSYHPRTEPGWQYHPCLAAEQQRAPRGAQRAWSMSCGLPFAGLEIRVEGLGR